MPEQLTRADFLRQYLPEKARQGVGLYLASVVPLPDSPPPAEIPPQTEFSIGSGFGGSVDIIDGLCRPSLLAFKYSLEYLKQDQFLQSSWRLLTGENSFSWDELELPPDQWFSKIVATGAKVKEATVRSKSIIPALTQSAWVKPECPDSIKKVGNKVVITGKYSEVTDAQPLGIPQDWIDKKATQTGVLAHASEKSNFRFEPAPSHGITDCGFAQLWQKWGDGKTYSNSRLVLVDVPSIEKATGQSFPKAEDLAAAAFSVTPVASTKMEHRIRAGTSNEIEIVPAQHNDYVDGVGLTTARVQIGSKDYLAIVLNDANLSNIDLRHLAVFFHKEAPLYTIGFKLSDRPTTSRTNLP